ncbi:curli production assembly/transport protein CsgE [Verticiella sediminum]|uniref:curli production assembly/transport protein CsgE n=1 Tax=Verticiella sediminum TaxID=1247510 RepID=UPI001FEA8332|nr:curli production assembly/transport protein CsgE [Verticiella sediminum]
MSEPVQAAPTAEVRRTADPMVGMVINRTITVLGREFYQHFAAFWRDMPESDRYSVSVHERPTAIRGSQVWVQFGQKRVFQAYLSPARAAAKDASQQAAQLSYKNVLDIEVARMLFQDRDLGPEEI